MTEPTTLESILLVAGGCGFITLIGITLTLQITIGVKMHRQEGCWGMLAGIHGLNVLLTGWRRVDEFNMRPLMIAYSVCLFLLFMFFCGTFAFLAMTGQLE